MAAAKTSSLFLVASQKRFIEAVQFRFRFPRVNRRLETFNKVEVEQAPGLWSAVVTPFLPLTSHE
jgi:hypothetical protein